MIDNSGLLVCARTALGKVRASLPKCGDVDDMAGDPISLDEVQLAVNTVGNMLADAEAQLAVELSRKAAQRRMALWVTRLVGPDATSGTRVTAVLELARIGKLASPPVPSPEDISRWPQSTIDELGYRLRTASCG